MNEERISALLQPIDDNAVRAEVREFAARPMDEQLVQLYLEVKGLKKSKPITDRLYDFGYVGALIAYMLFDQRDQLPHIGK